MRKSYICVSITLLAALFCSTQAAPSLTEDRDRLKNIGVLGGGDALPDRYHGREKRDTVPQRSDGLVDGSMTDYDVMAYLAQYDYLPYNPMDDTDGMGDDPMTDQMVTQAIMDFQAMAHVQVTGQLDDPTMSMMQEPRCGNSDKKSSPDDIMLMERRKRYLLAPTRWGAKDLYYRIVNVTSDMSEARVRAELKRALDVWSSVTDLTFTEWDHEDATFQIYFSTRAKGHDGFDGPGGVLAHAFFPCTQDICGDAHFDDDESYTADQFGGINLFQVAAHEFGHSLGLDHSEVQGALMAPFYTGYDPNFSLPQDDINGIQAHYGMKTEIGPATTTTTTTTTTTSTTTTTPYDDPDMPDFCDDSKPDAVTRDMYDRVLVFKDDLYWVLDWENGGVQQQPRRIADDWSPVPNKLDSALFVPSSCFGASGCNSPSYTYFFKNDKMWRFEGTTFREEYVLSETVLGVPQRPDAVTMYPYTNNIYFIKGDIYYRLTADYKEVASGYPRSMDVWWSNSRTEPPENIDTMFVAPNDRLYIFEEDHYYRFNHNRFKLGNSYPRDTSYYWYGCNPYALAALEEMEEEMEEEEEEEEVDDVIVIPVIPMSHAPSPLHPSPIQLFTLSLAVVTLLRL